MRSISRRWLTLSAALELAAAGGMSAQRCTTTTLIGSILLPVPIGRTSNKPTPGGTTPWRTVTDPVDFRVLRSIDSTKPGLDRSDPVKATSLTDVPPLHGGPVASSASADCCTDFWSCAAAVATGGVSCVIQGLIDTVNSLIAVVTDVRNSINSLAQGTATNSQQGVDTAADLMVAEIAELTRLIQQEADLAAKLASEEAQAQAALKAAGTLAAPPTTVQRSGATPAPIGQGGAPTASGPTSTSQTAGGAPAGSSAPSSASGAPITANKGAALSGGVQAGSISLAPALQPADPAAIADEMQVALKLLLEKKIEAEKKRLAILYQAQLAKQNAASGVQKAQTLVNQFALTALNTVRDWLASLLLSPSTLFDPTLTVMNTLDPIVNGLNALLDQVVAAVTGDANQALQAAQDPYTLLQARLEEEKQVRALMDKLHSGRTTGDLNALYAVAPPPNRPVTAATAPVLALPNQAPRLAFNTVMATLATSRQQAVAVPRQKLQALSTGIAQLKSLRVQGMAIRGAMPTYQGSFARQMDGYFAGKSAGNAATQRDQLITQARAQFARDPKTGDAVITLITEESNKRIQAIPVKRP